jgi:hypothetical protein
VGENPLHQREAILPKFLVAKMARDDLLPLPLSLSITNCVCSIYMQYIVYVCLCTVVEVVVEEKHTVHFRHEPWSDSFTIRIYWFLSVSVHVESQWVKALNLEST